MISYSANIPVGFLLSLSLSAVNLLSFWQIYHPSSLFDVSVNVHFNSLTGLSIKIFKVSWPSYTVRGYSIQISAKVIFPNIQYSSMKNHNVILQIKRNINNKKMQTSKTNVNMSSFQFNFINIAERSFFVPYMC